MFRAFFIVLQKGGRHEPSVRAKEWLRHSSRKKCRLSAAKKEAGTSLWLMPKNGSAILLEKSRLSAAKRRIL